MKISKQLLFIIVVSVLVPCCKGISKLPVNINSGVSGAEVKIRQSPNRIPSANQNQVTVKLPAHR